MKSFNKIFKGLKQQELLILVIFVIYSIIEFKTPKPLAELVDTLYGNIFVVVFAIVFFIQSKPIVGILSLVVAYIFIKRSSIETGTHAIRNNVPSESKKLKDFEKYNEFPRTLEEEVVGKMAPLVGPSTNENVKYRSVLNYTHNALEL